jgi:putative ABC transport system permease protein
MLRLILSDLVANARIWLGTLLIALATGAVGAVAASDIRTAIEAGGTEALALYAISGVMIAFTTITALIVAGSVAGLTVALQQRAYALWQLVGVRPGYVRIVVTTQLVVVSLIGSVLGCLAALPILGPLYRYSLAGSPELADLRPVLGAGGAVPVVVFVTLVVTLAGSRSAGRAARTPPIRSLHETDRPGQPMTAGRWVGGLIAVVAVAGIVASLPGTAPDQLSVPLMLIAPLTAGVLAAFAPLYLARLLRGWTALVPDQISSSWYLARSSTAYGVARSTATISPITVAVALAGGLYAANGTASGGGTVTAGSVVLLLGGPLLLALLGATATIFMAGRRRDREFALVVAAGATRAVVLAAAAWEAVIYTVTATILGAVAVGVAALAGGWAAETGTPSFGLGAIGTVALAGLLLTLVATVLPTAVALRRDLPQTLAAE